MRRLGAVAVLVLVTVTAVAGCQKSGQGASHAAAPAARKPDTGPGSTAGVCASIRSSVTADMTPLGTAFGDLAGRAAAGDTSGVAGAKDTASAALTKLSTDLTTAGAAATDGKLHAAADSAAQNVVGLIRDQSYLSGITSMDGVAAATAKLQQATQPITTACQGT